MIDGAGAPSPAELGVHRDTVALAIEADRFTNIAFRPAVAMLDPRR